MLFLYFFSNFVLFLLSVDYDNNILLHSFILSFNFLPILRISTKISKEPHYGNTILNNNLSSKIDYEI